MPCKFGDCRACKRTCQKRDNPLLCDCFLLRLADKYGFGKFKLHQILKTVTNLTEEIIADEISLDDLNKVLYEEYDVEIK